MPLAEFPTGLWLDTLPFFPDQLQLEQCEWVKVMLDMQVNCIQHYPLSPNIALVQLRGVLWVTS